MRTLVPVAVLAAVWLWVNKAMLLKDSHQLLEASVGVRHLLVAVAIVTLWNVWLVFSQYQVSRRDAI